MRRIRIADVIGTTACVLIKLGVPQSMRSDCGPAISLFNQISEAARLVWGEVGLDRYRLLAG